MFFERNVFSAIGALIALIASLCAETTVVYAQTLATPPTCAPFSFCELAGIVPAAPCRLFSYDDALTYLHEANSSEVFTVPRFSSNAKLFTQDLVGQDLSSENEVAIYRGSDLAVLAIDPYRGRNFGYGLASWGSQESQGVAADHSGFDVGSYGGALGQDWSLTNFFIWGYGVQGTQTELDGKRADSYDAKIDSLSGFLRLSVFDALWHIDMQYGAARNWETQTKLSNGKQEKFTTTQWSFESEFGARFDEGYTRIEPHVNFRVLSLIEPAAAERLLATQKNPKDFSKSSYRMKLGSRFSWEYATFLGVAKPYINVDWSHEFGNRAIYTIDNQAPVPVAYRFGKLKMPRDLLDLGAGLDYALRDTFDLYIRYDAEIASNYADSLFFAGFNKKF